MSACASSDTLEKLLLGELAAAEADSLRTHLTECARCRNALDEQSDHTELKAWASGLMNGTFQATPFPDDTRLSPLLSKLCASPLVDVSGPGTPVAYFDGPLTFLSPPKQPGDIGSLGPFRILSQLGRGGMGIVLKAYDTELRRVVALKVLLPSRADEPTARARFVREAQAAAALHHDNVVPVFSVSNPSAGAPYLVMPYVAGQTLRARIDSGPKLDAKEAAQICLQAAEGLAAAHHAGLVHRDVKPANIILDADQHRAKIMDFGLVRVKEQPGSLTEEGIAAGTPVYMSPEQILHPDKLDERTDIYSMGVTLYEAITGTAPFRGEPHMVVQQLLQDEPLPPRRLSDAVPRDLETICLKAMAKEPSRRYQTARELADDLRRFLNGEPIQARPVGRGERLWRWCRRKPALAGVTAALVLAVVVGFVAVFWQWRRAERHFQDADEQRAAAEASLQAAIATVNQFCTDVSQEVLLNEPGMQPLRKRLLETAREYYEQFVRERGDHPRLRRELANASLRLGRIVAELGAPADGLELIRRAVALADRLVADNPGNAQFADDRANTYDELGMGYRAMFRLPEAKTAFETALASADEMAHAHPQTVLYRVRVARISNDLGLLHQDMKEPGQAEPFHLRARDIWEALVQSDPGNEAHRDDLAIVYDRLGGVYTQQGNAKAAEAALARALVLRQELADVQPGVPRHQAAVASSHSALGYFYQQHKRTADGEAAFQKSIAIRKQLVADNPRVTKYHEYLANDYNTLGFLYWKAGQPDKAVPAFQSGLDIRERLAHDYPRHHDFQSQFADSSANLALVQRTANRFSEAEKGLLNAISIYEGLVETHPKVPHYRENLAKSRMNLGMNHRSLGQFGPAVDETRKALDIFKYLAREHSGVLEYPFRVGTTQYNIALLHKDQDQFEEAEKDFRETLAILEPLAREHPTRTEFVTMVARANNNLGHIMHERGRSKDALPWYDATEQAFRKILQEEKRSSEAKEGLRNVYWGRAQALEALARYPDAIADWDRALEIERQIDPPLSRDRLRLLRARTQAHAGNHAAAVGAVDEVLKQPSVPLDAQFAAASAFAAVSVAVRSDAALSTPDRERQGDAYATRAVETLAKVHAAGFFKNFAKVVQLRKDPDFSLLRERPDLQKIIRELDGKGDTDREPQRK